MFDIYQGRTSYTSFFGLSAMFCIYVNWPLFPVRGSLATSSHNLSKLPLDSGHLDAGRENAAAASETTANVTAHAFHGSITCIHNTKQTSAFRAK